MIIVTKGNQVATLINVYQTTPENQDHLVVMIIKSTEEVASKQNGYISAAVHKSIDGTRVTNYSQWTTPETLQAMLHTPEFKASFKDVMIYATSFEPHTYFISFIDEIMPSKSIVVKQYMEAAYTGNISSAREFLTDDVALIMSGKNLLGNTFSGKENLFSAFGKMMDITNGTYKLVEEKQWLENDNFVALFATETGRKNGVDLFYDRIILYQFDQNKIKSIRVFEGNSEIVDLLFS